MISSPEIPLAPKTTRSGGIVRPQIIRSLVKTSQAFEKAAQMLDRLFHQATHASQSGVPPPPCGTEPGGKR